MQLNLNINDHDIALYILELIQIEMEKASGLFIIEPTCHNISNNQDKFTFFVKNVGTRTCHYEIFVPDWNHLKINGDRTFSLAPGIKKNIKITHIKSQLCSDQEHLIEVIDTYGNRKTIEIICFEKQHTEIKKLEIPSQIKLQKLPLMQEKVIEIPIKNIGQQNYKVKISNGVLQDIVTKIKVKIQEEQFIMLKNTTKICRISLKMLEETEISVTLYIEIIEEMTRSKQPYFLRITCNSLSKSQYVINKKNQKIQCINNSMLNGTSLKGSFFLVNNYHQQCHFKINEVLQVNDYNFYTQLINELFLQVDKKEGIIHPKSKIEIFYEVFTSFTDNDKNFVQRYFQQPANDQSYVYKLRNSKYFKKYINRKLQIQFGNNNLIEFFINNKVVNPALRFNLTSTDKSQIYDLLNDTEFQIPYKINSNNFFYHKPEANVIKKGINHLEIFWKQLERPVSSSKQNKLRYIKSPVKLQILQYELDLFLPSNQLRPKTANLKESRAFLKKQSFREKISIRAPSKRGDVGVKQFSQISTVDYLKKENRYLNNQLLCQQQFKYLQVNYNQKGYILTNAHPYKNIIVVVQQKGYLWLKNSHSYLLPYEKKWLKIEHNGKILQLRAKQQYNQQQIYKIEKKELLFCFSSSQNQYQIIKQVKITNKSQRNLIVHCLSVDDEYFHSIMPNNKLIIPPMNTSSYEISFRPESEQKIIGQKITKQLEFLINNNKQLIICEGDFLPASIISDIKSLTFPTIPYSYEQITKTIMLTNKGLNKVSFRVQTSKFIRVYPQSGTIYEKSKQSLIIQFRPSQLQKNFYEQIKIQFRGSHIMKIPLKVNTQEPDIFCVQQFISFGTGYINQIIHSELTIVNQNTYPCTINIKLSQIEGLLDKQVFIQSKSTKIVQIDIKVNQVGEKVAKLSPHFIQLKGYGAIKGPKYYCLMGKQTILQLVPDNAFKHIECSLNNQTNTFILKNLSQNVVNVMINLTQKSNQKSIILSCQPKTTNIQPRTQKQFNLHSIRIDDDNSHQAIINCLYLLNIFINKQQLYRSIDLSIKVPPPQLQIYPSQIYFPLNWINSWSTAYFNIRNLGYKEVFIAIKKPTNITFDLQVQTQKNKNKLTKLDNNLQVKVLFKSKKPVSFSIILIVENNYGKKYQIKLYGTTSKNSLLKCDRGVESATSFSNSQIKSAGSMSAKSIPFGDSSSEENQNFKFFSKWIHGIFPESAKSGEFYNTWLKRPKNLLSLLQHIKINISASQLSYCTLDSILDKLKEDGYPIYTIRTNLLLEGNRNEWSNFLWFLLSKDMPNEECLKWLNKICGINLSTFDNAYNHQKKIIIDIMSKIFEPIYKSKVMDYQKLLDIFSPSIPILSCIENKRHFIVLLNLLYNKFSKTQVKNMSITQYNYNVYLPSIKWRSNCWILSDNSFSPQISGNYNEDIYLPDKKILSFAYSGQSSVSLKFKEDSCIAVWSNQCFDSLKIYKINLQKKLPIIHNITIQCQDQCMQQWNLDFVCNVESEYFYQFCGGNQFKCRTPQLGVIKAGSIMKFTVTYSPSDLKDHEGFLKISNIFEEHIYNLKGKPLRSRKIQMEHNLHIPQGEKYTFTFGIEDATNNSNLYTVKQLDTMTQQLKMCEAKTNSKQILITSLFQFKKVVQNKAIQLQITNKEGTFCRNVRLVINVIPKPRIIQGQLRGVIEKVTTEKIPLTNILNSKQICSIKIYKITKQMYQTMNYSHLDNIKLQTSVIDWQFKISHEKILFSPKENNNLLVSFLPVTFQQIYCQVRVKYESTQQLIVYNYRGVPQLPSIDNKLMEINCQIERQTVRTIKIDNKVKQDISFQVQTNINFIAGAELIKLGPRESYNYKFKLIPLHEGQYFGQLLFKNQKFCLKYPLHIKVNSNRIIETLKIQSKIRLSNTINLNLKNKTLKNIQYQIICQNQCLQFPDIIMIPPQSQVPLIMKYTPLEVGTKTFQLKLYNEKANQIIYLIQVIASPNISDYVIQCELGQPKKFKILLKNPTKTKAQIIHPKLPEGLAVLQNYHFPILLPAEGNVAIQMIYTQKELSQQRQLYFQFVTDKIGYYSYNILFTSATSRSLPKTLIEYQSDNIQTSTIQKQWFIQFFNPFEHNLQLKIPNRKIQYDQNITIQVDHKEEFSIKPFDKKNIKCKAILDLQSTKSNKNQKNNQIIFKSSQFQWKYPITFVEIKNISKPIEIIGPSHQVIRARVTLKNLRSVKKWQAIDLIQFQKFVKTTGLSSNDFYLQAIVNKNFQYQGYIKYYQEDLTCAQVYPLIIKIGRKVKPVTIEANVGQTSLLKIKIKNGSGKYHVQFKNNKKKEFNVFPLEGVFTQNENNFINFEYSPVEYNGCKKAEVTIYSEGGNFDFSLNGKFPYRKC